MSPQEDSWCIRGLLRMSADVAAVHDVHLLRGSGDWPACAVRVSGAVLLGVLGGNPCSTPLF
ncbi:hypothetical protein [Brevibacterium aurantiacum]|uniref:hypothetical protein n=1 Tax=Brevibacterium aurantiacum TaxID=273384 RepID=UPI001F496E34|nr:hypothetical protein [Brevibacterium aurantiacum]